MVSAAIARGTNAATSTSRAYSFWVDGNDLVNYLDWRNISIDLTSRVEENSRASFRLTNLDASLDFTAFWGQTNAGNSAYPLREVRLYDHTHDEPVFGGYVMGIRFGIMAPGRSYIDLECVGYSWLLDACVLTADVTFPVGNLSSEAIQSLVALCGLPGGIKAASGGTWTSDPNDIGIDTVFIQGPAASPVVVSAGSTLRAGIMAICARDQAYAVYIDNWKRLNVYTPANIFGAASWYRTFDPSSFPAEELDLEYDFGDYASHMYVNSATAAGRGWISARQMQSESIDDAIDSFHTYQSVAVSAYVTDDGSIDFDSLQEHGGRALWARQIGSYPVYAITKTGWEGWRLGHKVSVTYDQLRGGSVLGKYFGLAALHITFALPSTPIYRLTLVHALAWGSGGYTRTTDVGPDADQVAGSRITRTMAEQHKKKHKRRHK